MGLTVAAAPSPAPQAGNEADLAASGFAAQLDLFRRLFEGELTRFIDSKRQAASGSGQPELMELVDAVSALATDGGKRLRPALVYYTHLACRGGDPAWALPLAVATELLHTYLLIHDDIMDHAELRRGNPTAHVRFERLHRERGLFGDPAEFGRSVAILIGDLAYSWSVELALGVAASSERGAPIGRCFSEMGQEVIGGQYLEILVGHRRTATEAELERVLRLKSGRYTTERPIQLGALLAGASPSLTSPLRRYGSAIGEAFQLQDDLLGTFGRPDDLGKAIDSDLREGKYTFLIHHALAGAAAADRETIAAALGNPELTDEDFAAAVRAIERSGARDRVLAMVEERLESAQRSLEEIGADALEPEGRSFLFGLIGFLRERRQ